MTAVLIREAPTDRAGFLRRLVQALDGRSYVVAGDTVTADGGRITITLTAKQDAAGAGQMMADFSFDMMSDEEVRMFMERFDRTA